jgi:cytochrome c-type biogenesis protein CcmE
VIAAFALLAWSVLDGQWVKTISVSAYLDDPGRYGESELQIYGKIVAGSIEKQAQGTAMKIRGEDGRELKVIYTGLKYVNLKDNADVLVQCRAAGGEIKASSILTKCPSKYQSQQAGKT